MWHQGPEAAPFVVRKCYESWERHNPAWAIRFLDRETLSHYVDLDVITRRHGDVVTPQVLADLVRINLLADRGGVWADATCLCVRPLDDWLTEYTTSGFFAFRNPGPNRFLSTWFLAAGPGNVLALKWREAAVSYWRDNMFRPVKHSLLMDCLRRHLNRTTRSSQLWFSVPVRRWLRVYPYFWSHFLFARLLEKDGECRRVWEATREFSADYPHKMQFSGLLNPLSGESKAYIDSGITPMHKLVWGIPEESCTDGCTLRYLLESAITTSPFA